jgi:hypothetical protein
VAEQVRVDLEARDNASKVIDKVADAAEALEKLDPEVEVTADTGAATADLDQLADDAAALSKVDAEIVARARVDDARAELKRLQDDMRDTADTARRELDGIGAGATTAGDGLGRAADEGGRAKSAMANMGGNVASELGDIAGVGGIAAQSLGELAEAAAEGELSLGQLAKVAGPMAGLAVAMTVMSEAMAAANASKAFDAERVERYTDAIANGVEPVQALTDSVTELGKLEFRSHMGGGLLGLFSTTEDLVPTLARARIGIKEFSEMARDFGARSTDEWRASLEALGVSTLDAIDIVKAARDENAGMNDALQRQTDLLKVLFTDATTAAGAIAAVRDQVGGTIGDMAEWARRTGEVAAENDAAARKQDALTAAADRTREAFRKLRDGLNYEAELQGLQDAFGEALRTTADEGAATDEQIRAIKQSIIDVAEAAGANPVVVAAQLESVNQNDLWVVAGEVTSYYQRNPIKLATSLARPLNIPPGYAPGTGGGGVFPTSAPPDGGGVTNVSMTLPPGWRGDPLAAAHHTARRAGRLYNRVGRR